MNKLDFAFILRQVQGHSPRWAASTQAHDTQTQTPKFREPNRAWEGVSIPQPVAHVPYDTLQLAQLRASLVSDFEAVPGRRLFLLRQVW
jgi:hypothetical protein